MHIPDGFLSVPVSVGTGALSIGGLWLAIKNVQRKFADRMIPTMGVLAAFIFAAQMFNFPVAGGTSGHLMGGVLAAIVVGPMAATVILAVVLIVQCLVFQDGGLLAMGANVFNMAIIGTWIGWAVYAALSNLGNNKFLKGAATFIGSWISMVVAASACSLELAISGTVPIKMVLPAMLGVHSVIGIGEGVITLVVVSLIGQVKPEMVARKAGVR